MDVVEGLGMQMMILSMARSGYAEGSLYVRRVVVEGTREQADIDEELL